MYIFIYFYSYGAIVYQYLIVNKHTVLYELNCDLRIEWGSLIFTLLLKTLIYLVSYFITWYISRILYIS